MIFKEVSIKDMPAIESLTPKGWTNISSKFEFYIAHKHCFPIKLVIDDQIIGLGATIIHKNAAWLAHIIVDPKYRCKGYGTLITKKLISKAEHFYCKTISLIATTLGAYVYEKLGFITETTYLFYKLPSNTAEFKSDYIISFTKNYKNQILDLDQKVSGENRLATIKNHSETAQLYVVDNQLKGFLFPFLGEGLIIAEDENAGTALMRFRWNTHDNCVFPIDNTSAEAYMKNLGHSFFSTAKRMRLGNPLHTDFSKIYSRIGGYLG